MRRHPILGVIDFLVGAGILVSVWMALPARWWPIDVGGTVLALAFAGSGVGLILGKPWARLVGRVVAGLVLLVGLTLVTSVAVTAAHVAGLYGPVGKGGALILGLVAALLLPYLVMLPAAQLVILQRAGKPKKPSEPEPEP